MRHRLALGLAALLTMGSVRGQDPKEATLLEGLSGFDESLVGADVFLARYPGGTTGRFVIDVRRAPEDSDALYEVTVQLGMPTGRLFVRTLADGACGIVRLEHWSGAALERTKSYWWLIEENQSTVGPKVEGPHHHDLGALYLLARRVGPSRTGTSTLHGIAIRPEEEERLAEVQGELWIPDWAPRRGDPTTDVRLVAYRSSTGEEVELSVTRDGRVVEVFTPGVTALAYGAIELSWLHRLTSESAAVSRGQAIAHLASAEAASVAGIHSRTLSELALAREAIDEVLAPPEDLQRELAKTHLRAAARAADAYLAGRDAGFFTPEELERCGVRDRGLRAPASVLRYQVIHQLLQADPGLLTDSTLAPLARTPYFRCSRWFDQQVPREQVWEPDGGAVTTGDVRFDELWHDLAQADARATVGEVETWIRQNTPNTGKGSPSARWRYLIMFSLLDPQRHGGWPYRAQLLFDERIAPVLVADALAHFDADPSDFNAFAFVNVAIAARRYVEARRLLTQLRGSNRFLCDVALSHASLLLEALKAGRIDDADFVALSNEVMDELVEPTRSP